MSYVVITKQEFDNKLMLSKGWFCTQSGNEYIYDFHLKKYPIIVKVASSIRIDTDRARNKGSDAIRIFAVQKEGLGKRDKITGGLIKARRVYRTTNWRDNLERQVMSVIISSKVVYDNHRRKR